MRFHLPKPLHGWREFVGEVGIIVIGVLIALGAEQVVESWHWRNAVAEYRAAADRELAFDYAAFQYRLGQSRCVGSRIAELDEWDAQWRSGTGKPLMREIGRPSIITARVSVRDSAPADVLARMRLAERTAYAAFYDTLDNNWQQMRDEREAWRSLGAYNHATALTHEDLMRLDELIYRVKSIDRVLRLNVPALDRQARELGIKPSFGSDPYALPDNSFCQPVLAQG